MDKLLNALIACMCILPSAAFALSIDTMSEAELKETGIAKLTDDEKKALRGWLVKNEPPQPLIEKDKIVHGILKVTDVVELGRFVTLDNGHTYDIYSRSRKKTLAWKLGDTIRLLEQIKAPSYKLENVSKKKQTVSAKVKIPS